MILNVEDVEYINGPVCSLGDLRPLTIWLKSGNGVLIHIKDIDNITFFCSNRNDFLCDKYEEYINNWKNSLTGNK